MYPNARSRGSVTIPLAVPASRVSDDKYDKKRRKRKTKSSIKQSVPHVLALLALFSCILSLWHVSHRRLYARRTQDAFERQKRAQELLKLNALPHARGGQEEAYHRTRRLEQEFADQLGGRGSNKERILSTWLQQVDSDIVNNVKGGVRWIRPYLLPHLPGEMDDDARAIATGKISKESNSKFLKVKRGGVKMKWEEEYDALAAAGPLPGPAVDYTDRAKYKYPSIDKHYAKIHPPKEYPPLRPLRELMENWPQDEDFTGTIHEQLMHFNYSDPKELEMARMFRDHEVPFKLYGVPEVELAGKKWTDDYVAKHFGSKEKYNLYSAPDAGDGVPLAGGNAQESPNNFFAFFNPSNWDTNKMGLPPVRNNDWPFETWAKHARYADAVRLDADKPHFYWQSGVPREERHEDYSQWTFISRDLPSFSSPTETFFVFHPEEQKGIQCRFGERGVVAATHYDGGRNFVAMMTGAKRYILSPPRACKDLGIFTSRRSSIYRHSLLNFGHIRHLNDPGSDMSDEERKWLERAGQAESLETVLKAGEVLYIPSHWFHYIVSIQKSAQCNVRSGIDKEGHPAFGNRDTVEKCGR